MYQILISSSILESRFSTAECLQMVHEELLL